MFGSCCTLRQHFLTLNMRMKNVFISSFPSTLIHTCAPWLRTPRPKSLPPCPIGLLVTQTLAYQSNAPLCLLPLTYDRSPPRPTSAVYALTAWGWREVGLFQGRAPPPKHEGKESSTATEQLKELTTVSTVLFVEKTDREQALRLDILA